jgi:hypothetical protein
LLEEICVPNVAPLLQSGRSDDGRRYFAVPNPGQQLKRTLTRRGGLELESALRLCSEGVAILGALAAAGIGLPDAGLHRFEVEGEERLWLVDLDGASRVPSGEAQQSHARLARDLCSTVIERGRRYILSPGLLKAMETADGCAALSRVLLMPHG